MTSRKIGPKLLASASVAALIAISSPAYAAGVTETGSAQSYRLSTDANGSPSFPIDWLIFQGFDVVESVYIDEDINNNDKAPSGLMGILRSATT